MLKFEYTAKSNDGKEKKGIMEALNESEVAIKLKEEGFWITSLKEMEEKKKTSSFGDAIFTVPLKEKMIFCRHLAVMIESGLSLNRALLVLIGQEKNRTFKKNLEKIHEEIKKGVSLADAMAKHPKTFNQVFISMVKVGEGSGNLEEILKILAKQLEKDHKLISKIRGALIYPGVIMSVMIIIGILMMMFVVPKITAIFNDFDAQLPLLTKILIGISNFMAQNVLVTLGIIFGSLTTLFFFYRSAPGKKVFHLLFLKLPVIGNIVNKVNSARFSRILSSLLTSGVSLVKALRITSNTLGNYYYSKGIKKAAQDVQKGVPLSKILSSENSLFPYLVIQMIEVGEETGKSPEILKKLAEFYESEVDQISKNLSSIIEPILMVVIGSAVGLFAIAIIQPIYSIMEKV